MYDKWANTDRKVEVNMNKILQKNKTSSYLLSFWWMHRSSPWTDSNSSQRIFLLPGKKKQDRKLYNIALEIQILRWFIIKQKHKNSLLLFSSLWHLHQFITQDFFSHKSSGKTIIVKIVETQSILAIFLPIQNPQERAHFFFCPLSFLLPLNDILR